MRQIERAHRGKDDRWIIRALSERKDPTVPRTRHLTQVIHQFVHLNRQKCTNGTAKLFRARTVP